MTSSFVRLSFSEKFKKCWWQPSSFSFISVRSQDAGWTEYETQTNQTTSILTSTSETVVVAVPQPNMYVHLCVPKCVTVYRGGVVDDDKDDEGKLCKRQ